MALEEINENIDNIQKNAEDYIENSLAYYKLWSFKVAMKSTTMAVKFILIFFCFMMVLLFFSIAGAFFIGGELNNYPLGFLIVAGIYVFVIVLLFLIKDRIVEGTVLEKFSEIFFKD